MLFTHGSIPFLAVPTFPQSTWAQGFAKSFANEGLFSIYANNFGWPNQNPIAFGLSAMLPSSYLLRIGLNSADSYSLIFLIYLSAAYFGAYSWSKIFLNRKLSCLAALVWTTLPINVVHQKYSMVSLGMVMLPLFCYIIYKFYTLDIKKFKNSMEWILVILTFTTISVFMDGYTFVMFAYFAFVAWFFISMLEVDKIGEKRLIYQSILKLFAVLFSFFVSFLLYDNYFPGFEKWDMPIEFYRAWGLDLSFLIIPTTGENLIFDYLNLSVIRSQEIFFGDSSVWVSTFCLPILIGFLFSFFGVKNKNNLFLLMVFISFTSLYFAMGPSLKFFSFKPSPEIGQLMDSKYAVISTGSEFFYSYIPGFKAMRATYRWSALFLFSAWLLTIKGISQLKNNQNTKYFIFIIIFAFSIPNIVNNFSKSIDYRKMSNEFEDSVSIEVSSFLTDEEIALFLPLGNNFIVNFLSSHGEFKSYNIGGDKNVMLAGEKLPKEIKNLNNSFISASMNNFKNFNYDELNNILLKNTVVVIPYFDMTFPTNDYIYESYCFKSITTDKEYLDCIDNNVFKDNYINFIQAVENDKRFNVIKKDMYMIIKDSLN